MKKLLYLLLLLPMSMVTSCDKDDLAPFDMTLTLGGVTQSDGAFYAVAGQNITIENLTVTPVGGKNTTVANVMFFIDNYPVFGNPWNVTDPLTFSTAGLAPGTHTIGITGNLLQVDQSIQDFAATYTLVLTESQEDLPAGAPELGSYSHTISFSK